MATSRKNKYEQVILYLCDRLGGEIRGKKKLAKLLYFADFDFFEKYQKSLTGDMYRSLPMGPFPVSLETVTKEMAKKKLLDVKGVEEWEGYNSTETYRSARKSTPSVLSEEEKKMLDRVARRYGHLNGKQLEDITHAEAPYVGTELKAEIPYELAFYRGTDFSDL